ncbi:MAG: TetR/AcrR family transcriptional regulator [Acidimicrobiales bacterium]
MIDVAMDNYWREGTDAVSLNELCRRAGVSKPALYREFGGEDGLMDATLEHYAETVLAPMLDLTTHDDPFEDVLASMIDIMIDLDRDMPPGCLLAKMRVLSSRLGAATQTRTNNLRVEAQARYADWVERAKARGDITADIPTTVAAAFIDNQFTALLTQVALGEDPDMLRAQSRLTFAGLTGTTGAIDTSAWSDDER